VKERLESVEKPSAGAKDRRRRQQVCESVSESGSLSRRLTSTAARLANLTVVRAKMNLSIGTPILCILLMVLLLETAHARPADWFLRYGEENQIRSNKSLVSTMLEIGPRRSRSEKCLANKIAAFP